MCLGDGSLGRRATQKSVESVTEAKQAIGDFFLVSGFSDYKLSPGPGNTAVSGAHPGGVYYMGSALSVSLGTNALGVVIIGHVSVPTGAGGVCAAGRCLDTAAVQLSLQLLGMARSLGFCFSHGIVHRACCLQPKGRACGRPVLRQVMLLETRECLRVPRWPLEETCRQPEVSSVHRRLLHCKHVCGGLLRGQARVLWDCGFS